MIVIKSKDGKQLSLKSLSTTALFNEFGWRDRHIYELEAQLAAKDAIINGVEFTSKVEGLSDSRSLHRQLTEKDVEIERLRGELDSMRRKATSPLGIMRDQESWLRERLK